jgi:hypothetical protein
MRKKSMKKRTSINIDEKPEVEINQENIFLEDK